MNRFTPILLLIFSLLTITTKGQNISSDCRDSSLDIAYYLRSQTFGTANFISTKDKGKLLLNISNYNATDFKYSIAKLSATGVVEWNKALLAINVTKYILVQTLLELTTGDFVIGLKTGDKISSAFCLLKFDAIGNILWQRNIKIISGQ